MSAMYQTNCVNTTQLIRYLKLLGFTILPPMDVGRVRFLKKLHIYIYNIYVHI